MYILPLGAGWNAAKLTALVVALALTVATGAQYVAAAFSRSSETAPPASGGGAG
jgi:hypothetical protein